MLHTLSALELGQKLAQRDVSALEVADYFLDRVALVDSQVNAFLTVEPEVVRAQAVAAQALIDSAAGGPLTGVPIALKDNQSPSLKINLHIREGTRGYSSMIGQI